MILKGNQRAGGRQMALHLLNGEQNDHVSVHEVRGFMAQDVLGALNEAYALSKGTQCKQFMYSLSLSPPQEAKVSIATFEKTLERIEKKLGLEGQPRVIVFHEKEGRRHAHCVWSRIDSDAMKAIPLSFPKLKLNEIAKSLYIEHGWQMPDGFRDKNRSNPLNYTRQQWQQAMRVGKHPSAIKQDLQECWAVSDSKASFENALQDYGYALARGDKRGFVAVDIHGEIYSLSRQIEVNKNQLAQKLGDPQSLPSVDEINTRLQQKRNALFDRYADDLKAHHAKQSEPLQRAKRDMTQAHQEQRAKLAEFQKERWQTEELERSKRVRHGFKGLWDKLNGRYWKTRKQNELETENCRMRDQKQTDHFIHTQLCARQDLQKQIVNLREQQELEQKSLLRDLGQPHEIAPSEKSNPPEKNRGVTPDFEIDNDLEI
jgi:hypothetical protein